MNTKQLKKTFPRFYNDFFCNASKVTSAPHSFIWVGDFSNFYGGFSICSKIPFRFYAGLEEIGGQNFELEEDFFAYNPTKNRFEKITLDDYIVRALREQLKDELAGYRLRLFSELILGLSLGGLGALSAAISALIYDEPSQRAEFAEEISRKIQRGRSSPITALTALSDSEYPLVVSSREKKSWSKTLDKMFHLSGDMVWPLDFGLIFSGDLVQGPAVIASAESLKKASLKRQTEIEQAVGYKISPYWQSYIDILEQIAGRALLGLKELFLSGQSAPNLRAFFRSLNQYQNLLQFVDISTANIDKVYSEIHRLSNVADNMAGSGCKITGVGKGGEVLFALPFGRYRDEVEKMTEKIFKNGSANLHYASWRDGFESGGATVEQDLQGEIYSDYVKGQMYEVIQFNKGKISRFLSKDKKIIAQLIFDLEEKKIVFKGKKINSKLIPSQKAACEIMAKIFSFENYLVSNEQLPKTYGQSRFDLQSKVVSPLEKIFGLKFEITGTSFNEFTLKLVSAPQSLMIIKKLPY